MNEVVLRLKRFIEGRRLAYNTVFPKESEASKRVLADLAKFCRANETTFHTDPRLHAVLEGRREVYLRILDHLKRTEEELWAIYGRKDLE